MSADRDGHFPSADLAIDNWDDIDPADAANLQMAMDFGLDIPLSNAESIGAHAEAEELAALKRFEEEKQRLEEDLALQEELVEYERWELLDQDSVAEDGDEEEGDEKSSRSEKEDEETGMETFESREFLEEEYPFEVVKVLARKKLAPSSPSGGGISLEDRNEGFVDEEVVLWEYKVQWNHQGGISWERKDWLIDQGYGTLLKDYDKKKGPMPPTSFQHRPPKPPGIRVSKMTKMEREKLRRELRQRAEQLVKLTETGKQLERLMHQHPKSEKIMGNLRFNSAHPGLSNIESLPKKFLPKGMSMTFSPPAMFIHNVMRWFYEGGMRVSCLAPVGDNVATLDEFIEKNQGKKIVPVSHGTAKTAVKSIAHSGLRVPNTHGVTVVNGSALGVGIYSGRQPGISQGYARGHTNMFLCAGVEEIDPNIKSNPGVHVYFADHLILPLFYVEFERLPYGYNSSVGKVSLETLPAPGIAVDFNSIAANVVHKY